MLVQCFILFGTQAPIGADGLLQDVVSLAVQMRGLGSRLCTAMYCLMAAINSGTLQRNRRAVTSRKKRSTLFNQEAEVGVKWM